MVMCSSGGVTKWNRPGLDLSKQPPAVRMNDDLGGILTYKLKGEDAVRNSGIPFAIVRPSALTDELGGAPLVFDQGDDLMVWHFRQTTSVIYFQASYCQYIICVYPGKMQQD